MANTIIILVASLIAGLFGTMGGSDKFSKVWRRYGIPAIVFAVSSFLLNTAWTLLVLPLIGALSIGYGIPDENDKGSAIGAWWYRLTKDPAMTDICTRATAGVAIVVSVTILPILTGSWLRWLWTSSGVIGINIIFGGNAIVSGEGMFKLFGAELSWEEFLIAFLNTFLILAVLI
jgi:hypothetical protein